MFDFFNHIPEWIGTFIVVVPLIVAGGLVLLGIVNKQADARTKERQDEANALAERVRVLYKDESDAQNEKIKDQNEKLKELSERLATVEGENKTFRSLLTGNDDAAKNYRARVEASLTLVDKLAEVIMENGKKTEAIMVIVEQTNKNIEVLAKAIAKK